MPIMDAFWGDRYGQVVDPYGHKWAIATRKRVPTDEEIRAAVKAFSDKEKSARA
jgi:PhnB protein